MPSMTVPVSSTSDTMPVARVAYHRSVDPLVIGALSGCQAIMLPSEGRYRPGSR
jgi:hypothetical protein